MFQDEVEENSGLDESSLKGSVELDEEEVPSTDITFECPHCSKSLSIDPRGAGLVIICTQCGQPVTVPIPEGLEIEDFDATPEALSIQLLSARQNMAKMQAHITEMEEELDALRAFRDSAVSSGADRKALRAHIRSQLAVAGKIQYDMDSILREISSLMVEPEEE